MIRQLDITLYRYGFHPIIGVNRGVHVRVVHGSKETKQKGESVCVYVSVFVCECVCVYVSVKTFVFQS